MTMEPKAPDFEGLPSAPAGIEFDDKNWDLPQHLALGQITTALRMPTVALNAPKNTIEIPRGPTLDIDALEFDDPLSGRTIAGSDFLDRRLFSDALVVYADGAIRYEQYRNGVTETDHHIIHSCTKSLTTLMVGIAVDEGLLDTTAPIATYVPELGPLAAWEGVTVQHVLDMSTGIHTDEHYEDPNSMYWRYAEAVGYYGGSDDALGALGFVVENLTEQARQPGEIFNYSSPVTNLLPLCLSAVYGKPATELYEQYLHSRIGAESDALVNTDRFGVPIVEGHLNLTLRDFTRWALLFLHDGLNLNGERVVPASWISDTISPSTARRDAFIKSEFGEVFETGEYHNQTWIINPAAGQLAMLGIHGQFAYLDRQRDVLIAGFGSYPVQVDGLNISSMVQLWDRVSHELDASRSSINPATNLESQEVA